MTIQSKITNDFFSFIIYFLLRMHLFCLAERWLRQAAQLDYLGLMTDSR